MSEDDVIADRERAGELKIEYLGASSPLGEGWLVSVCGPNGEFRRSETFLMNDYDRGTEEETRAAAEEIFRQRLREAVRKLDAEKN